MKTEKKLKGDNVWLVNVSIEKQSLMFQFPTQDEQMDFVETIKGRVDSYVYALTPVELIKQKKPKKEKK